MDSLEVGRKAAPYVFVSLSLIPLINDLSKLDHFSSTFSIRSDPSYWFLFSHP